MYPHDGKRPQHRRTGSAPREAGSTLDRIGLRHAQAIVEQFAARIARLRRGASGDDGSPPHEPGQAMDRMAGGDGS